MDVSRYFQNSCPFFALFHHLRFTRNGEEIGWGGLITIFNNRVMLE